MGEQPKLPYYVNWEHIDLDKLKYFWMLKKKAQTLVKLKKKLALTPAPV